MRDIDGTTRVAGLSSGAGTWVSPDFDKPMELVDQQHVAVIHVPEGFSHEEALQRINRLVIALLESGMSEREINKRLARYHPMVEGV